MPDQTRESRPAGNGTAITNNEVATSSLAHAAIVRHDDTSPFALVLAGVARRRVFFNLPAAERALGRARDRGEDAAHLELVRLQLVATIGRDADV